MRKYAIRCMMKRRVCSYAGLITGRLAKEVPFLQSHGTVSSYWALEPQNLQFVFRRFHFCNKDEPIEDSNTLVMKIEFSSPSPPFETFLA